VQVHPPPVAAFAQLTLENPTADRGPSIPAHVTVVPESIKHPASSWMVAVPVVVVPSVYVPFAFAVHVPLTLIDPEIDVVLQVRGSRPTSEMSRAPLKFTHDDVTFQVPTTLPPQGDPFGQDGPPVPADPVVPPPELPPVPVWLFPVELQAPEIIANAIAIARVADWTFIEGLLTMGIFLSS
jgi:hypothetical protein